MKSILPTLFLAAALVAPAAATAETAANDSDARQLTALGGTIVWVSGQQPARLMMRAPDGTVSDVPGTRERAAYRNPDLGRDAKNRLVLTYARCSTLTKCTYVRDDLRGKATAFTGLAPENCALGTTPAVWRSSVAYALACFKRVGGKRVADAARSGLYLKTGSKKAVRFSVPREAKRAGATSVTDVDLRGTRIAALYQDISSFAVVQSTTGSLRRTLRVGSSEGDTDHRTAGVTIGTGDARLWTLATHTHPDDSSTVIRRIGRDCDDYQTLRHPAGPGTNLDYTYTDLTADGDTLYAIEPGVGILEHTYRPTSPGC